MTDNAKPASAGTSETAGSPSWFGRCIRIPLPDYTILAVPEAIHLLIRDDGTASVWCNGTGMGQLTVEQRTQVEVMLANKAICRADEKAHGEKKAENAKQ